MVSSYSEAGARGPPHKSSVLSVGIAGRNVALIITDVIRALLFSFYNMSTTANALRRSACLLANAPCRRSTRLLAKQRGPLWTKRQDPPSSKKKRYPKKRPTVHAGMVYLRVNRRFLLLPNPPTPNQPNPPPSQPPPGATGNLNLIAGQLPRLQRFDTTVDWLIRVARLILDPRGAGVLYTFQTGTVEYWSNQEMNNSWRQVGAGEQLAPTIYEYRRLDGQPMEPTRISNRHCRFTLHPADNQATAFRASLLLQHPYCIISPTTTLPELLRASHLMPVRLGDQRLRHMFHRFTGVTTAVTRYHRSVGVSLNLCTDAFVDKFDIGFWDMGNVGSYFCALSCTNVCCAM
jgi:hypothetical protein